MLLCALRFPYKESAEPPIRFREFLCRRSRACVTRGKASISSAAFRAFAHTHILGLGIDGSARARVEKKRIGLRGNLHGVCMALIRMHARGVPSISRIDRARGPAGPWLAPAVAEYESRESIWNARIYIHCHCGSLRSKGVPLTWTHSRGRATREAAITPLSAGEKTFELFHFRLLIRWWSRSAMFRRIRRTVEAE